MYYKIIRNDILKSKTMTLTTMIFVVAAAMLVSLAAILGINLLGSIDTLMEQAKTPHFMQMHSGEIDISQLGAFAEQNGNVDEFQVLEFLNIDGAQIIIGKNSLANSVQDNGLCTQSKRFDYLLDLDGKVIKVSPEEIYIPISYMKDGSAKVGEPVVICGKEFTVAGFLRDSQMNSLLASSKRFLVNENDYAKIRNLGNTEYLIEFRLKDLSTLGAFETAYTSAGLESNGPVVTYPLLKTINAISDGLMIGVILIVSLLVVAIAFMCIRFTLLAKIEDDYREIGVMKAIGLKVNHIKKIYLVKYTAIGGIGCILGFILSFLFRGMLLENIRLYMGKSKNSSFALLFGMVCVLFIFLSIIIYVNNILKRFRKISAAEAIRFGTSQEKLLGAKNFSLSKNKLFDTNIFLAIKDVLSRKKIYTTMFMVFVISAFIIIVPRNLYNTISSKEFITYMGIGKTDMRIDIQQINNISEKSAEIVKAMENDSYISKYTMLTTKAFKVKIENGSEERIKIELGDHSIFPVRYSEGRAPVLEDEIALSVINANELGKKVGDAITLMTSRREKDFKVCGIYSDITNGGKTAKAVFSDNSADTMWTIIYADILDKSLISSKVSEYANKFSFAKVSDIDKYIIQTFSSTIRSVEKGSYVAIIVALVISGLVTLLFMKMLIAKDKYNTAVMKALGFTNSDITVQYVSRSIFVLIAGIVFGTLLANTLGEMLIGAIISLFGASSFNFTINPLSAYIFCPLMMICSVLIATIIGTSHAGKIKIFQNIKE
ncbi:ABC transporter permease [Sporanaerobacter sp. PP17-6a]|uniref:ABC transporter permease n=1 Tax=Sporanaerobacter sp. PP17-6a TaxID=1891289 RepID=UPI0008A0597A|nr:FtsX-like permease family protein [Sporanaerobacter sp. PP17-6a]SCL88410.1 FtsX-like permease family protein [Sporanaerobacter sp. PP17-6a]